MTVDKARHLEGALRDIAEKSWVEHVSSTWRYGSLKSGAEWALFGRGTRAVGGGICGV